MLQSVRIILLYCAPILLALCIILNDYHNRVLSVEALIASIYQAVLFPSEQEQVNVSSLDEKSPELRELITFLTNTPKPIKSQNVNGQATTSKQMRSTIIKDNSINENLMHIWLSNSMIVLAMTLLPFLLMSLSLATATQLKLTKQQKFEIAKESIVIKFLLGCIIAVAWIYILNPRGRGAGTIESYLISIDLFKSETLPLYLKSNRLEPIIAAFLGWYLHALSYLFTKLIHQDVASSHVYNHLFKKFLFVYGIAIILPPIDLIPEDKVSLVLFLLGFFPLAAYSLMKEQLSKWAGSQRQEGYLTILPGISRWQVLRLEEEGIDTMSDLAAADKAKIIKTIPSLAKIINYWVEIAQLYVIVGHENYMNLKKRCNTSTSFVKQSSEPEFKQFILDNNLGNAEEIAYNLCSNFSIKN